MSPRHFKRDGATSLRMLFAGVCLLSVPLVLCADDPAWWHSGDNPPIKAADRLDYAAVNQGQLKNLARVAMEDMDTRLPQGAGDDIHSLVDSWSFPSVVRNDYAAVNIGQVKKVAKAFYDQLIAVGYTNGYPWDLSNNSKSDFALANIGQVKNVFSFDLTGRDWSSSQLPDWWKLNLFGTLNVDPNADPDGDGDTNLQEYQNGTHPNGTNQTSLLGTWKQEVFGTLKVDMNADPDGDGLTNLQEFQAGTDPNVQDNPKVKLEVNVIVR